MKKIIIANWKMQLSVAKSQAMLSELAKANPYFHDLVVSPDFLVLQSASKLLAKTNVELAAQNCAREKNGAFTGEISAANLKEVGVNYVIVGHNERRTILREDKSTIKAKVKVALDSGLKVILCVGENVMERRAGRTRPVIAAQLRSALGGLKVKQSDIIVAYEPVWAIGRGRSMDPEEVNKALAYINRVAHKLCDQNFKTIYGGSVNLENASSLLEQKNLAGLLVGGASLEFKTLNSLLNLNPKTK